MAFLSIGQVWAADQTVTWTASSGALGKTISSVNGTSSGTIATTATNLSYSWNYTRTLKSGEDNVGWSSNCIQLGKNGGVENVEFTTSNIPGIIKSVSVECASYQGKHKVAITVGGTSYLASTATSSWTTVDTKSGTGTSSGTITISFTNGSSARAMYIKSISVTYNNDGGSTDPTLSLEPTSKEFEATGNSVQVIALTASNFTSDITSVACTFFSDAACENENVIERPNWVTEPTVNAEKTEVSVNAVDNGGSARYTWMKITASNASESASAIFAISQKKYSAPTGTFELFSGDIEEGDYVIYYNGKAMNTTISSNRFQYAEVTPSNNTIVNPDESLIWHIARISETSYWTLYSEADEKYAGGTDSKGQGAMMESITDLAKWSISGNSTYEFENYGRSQKQSDSDKKYLRNNDTYGFACYSNSTGGALTLYKKEDGKPATPTFSPAGGSYLDAQNVTISAVDGAEIRYTLDGTIPTNTSTLYNGAIAVNSTTTIKAIAIKDAVSSNVATATYTITTPLTVAAAIALIPNVDNQVDDQYVEGYVCTAGTSVNSNGQMSYYISADGQDDGVVEHKLQIYKGKNLNNTGFSSESDLAVGDKVVVFGQLVHYNATTYEMNSGNYIKRYTAKGAVTSVVVSGTPTKTAYTASDHTFTPAGLVVTVTYASGYSVEVTDGITWGDNLVDHEVMTSCTVYVTASVGGVPSAPYPVNVEFSAKTLVSIAISQSEFEQWQGLELPKPTVTATYSEGEPADVTALAEFTGYDASTPGEQPITVSYTFGGETKNANYTVTVKSIYNVELAASVARDLIIRVVGNTESTNDMIVRGIVSYINNASSNTQTYWISDDGTRTNEVQIYKGKYIENAGFTSENQLKVGDEVVVTGKVINYNNNNPEFASEKSQVTSLARTPNFSIDDVASFELDADGLAVADLTIAKDGEGEVTIASSDNTDHVSIVDGKLHAVAVGTATITANLAANGIYKAASTTFEVTVIPATIKYTITIDGNGADGGVAPEAIANKAADAEVSLPENTWTKTDYKFAGWKVTYVDGESQVQEVTVNNGKFIMPAFNVTIQAQWAEGSELNWVAATWASANNITSNTNLEGNNATIDADANISLTWNKASGNNVPAYNSNYKEARLYQNTTLQIAAVEGKLIKKVTFTFTSNNTGTLSANVGTYSSSVWAGLANVITFTNTGSAAYIKSINIEYLNGTVTTLNIENVSLMLSAGTKNLSISCNINPTPTISFEIAEADQAIATVADGVVTANAIGGPISVTARIAQGENYTEAVANFTITVTDKTPTEMSFPEESYDTNLGTDFAEPILTTDPENLTVAYSSSVEAVATVDASTGAITLVGEGTTVITATFAGNDDYAGNTATYTLNVIDPNKDVLTANAIEVSGSYADWSDKTFGSGVKYAGNSTTGTGNQSGTIQMRVQNPSGIVTTTAIGYLKSISATATKNGSNSLSIYAKGTAYESAADLYDNKKWGTLIGTISKDGGDIVFEEGKAYSDNYKYIGIKANGGAVYYDEITITWTPAEFESFDVTYQPGEVTAEPVVQSVEDGSVISLAAANTFAAPEGKIFAGWLKAGEENVREAGSNYTVTEAVTFVAQWITVYTITYTAGDGTGDDITVENVQAGDYELAANTFAAPESKEFAGWKLNNQGDVLEAGSTYNVTGNASFTAQWSIVKQAAGLAYATTSYIVTRGRSFVTPELTNPHHLTVTYSGNNNEVATVDPTTGAVTLQGGIGEVTVTATSAATDAYYAGEASYTLKVKDVNLSGGWERLTSSSTLVDGMNVIVAEYVSSGNNINAMGAQNTNNRGQVAGTLDGGKLVADEGTAIFTLEAVGENPKTFAFKASNNKYLFAASSTQNYLREQATIDGNATWTISLDANGKATITAQGTNTHKVMRYNSGSDLFSCYESGKQSDIALYSKTVSVTSGTKDASTLDDYADVVVAEGATLVIDESAANKPLGIISGNVTVNAPMTAEGVHLGVNNTMNIYNTVTAPSFSISVKLGSTGVATNVNVNAGGSIQSPEGYVDMELSDNANPAHWHSFTVPFEVDALNGIYDANTGAKLQNEVNYAIMVYHSDIRANGDYGWKKYRGTLQPGTFYLITIDGDSKVLRFMKKAGSGYVAGNSMEMTYYSGSGALTDFGWCGVGNRNMFNGYVQGFVAQVLNAAGTGYEAINANASLSACIPFFIQVNVTSTLVMRDEPESPGLAPRRTAANGIEKVNVTFGNEAYTDNLYISASEDATNQYEIGKDLLKMRVTNTPNVPQIFGKAYGQNLCMVDAQLANNQAIYNLDLYAPAAGTYSISAQQVEDATLYVTYNGAIIWNLSLGDYELDLARGTTTGYGLLLVAQPNQMPTGVENGELLNGENGVQKILLNGNLYILRDGHLYDAVGKQAR